MRGGFARRSAWFLLGLGTVGIVAVVPLPAQAKKFDTKKQAPQKLDPVVIRLEGADKGNYMGREVLMVRGREALTGQEAKYAVENEPPQQKYGPAVFAPRTRIKEELEKSKPGDYIKLELKKANNLVWIERVDQYKPDDHEAEPGIFLVADSYAEERKGGDVYVIKLTKFAKPLDCYAEMVTKGKKQVPDPTIIALTESVGKRNSAEVVVAKRGNLNIVTSIDPYQDPKPATFLKLTEAEVGGAKVPAVELKEEGLTATRPLAGRSADGKWTTDPTLLSDAKRLRPNTPVVFKTRMVEGTEYVRQVGAGKVKEDPFTLKPKSKPESEEMKPEGDAKKAK